MARLRADEHRYARSVWLGPRGSSLWFEWTYVQWGMLLVGIAVSGWLSTAVLRLFLDSMNAGIYGWIVGGGVGGWFGVRLGAGASPDQPLLYRAVMFGHILTSGRRRPLPRRAVLTVRLPPITDLSPGARRAIGWAPDPTITPTTRKELVHVDRNPSTPRRRPRWFRGRGPRPRRAVV